MAYKFRWHTVGEKICFACERWDTQTFEGADALPNLPVHAHCKCFVKAYDPNTKLLEEAALQLKGISSTAQGYIHAFQKLHDIHSLRGFLDDFHTSIYALEQIVKTASAFWKNYLDMREANFHGGDKYFHSKANAQAAQLGKIGEQTAKLLGELREFHDFWKGMVKDVLILEKKTIEVLRKDKEEDLSTNAAGRRIGKQNPASDIKDELDIFRPIGLDEKY